MIHWYRWVLAHFRLQLVNSVRFALVLWGVSAPNLWAVTFNKFADYRQSVLDLVGSATTDLIVATDFLTDSEVVTALYLAKYRGVSVKVLLGAQKANHVMSRLTYLKTQKIDAYLIPGGATLKKGTTVIADGKVFQSDADLDNRSTLQKFNFDEMGHSSGQSIKNAVLAALSSPKDAVPRPSRLVGRPGKFNNYYTGDQKSKEAQSNSNVSGFKSGADLGAYNYNMDMKKQKQVPNGVSNKLPSETVFQKREKQKSVDAKSEADKF